MPGLADHLPLRRPAAADEGATTSRCTVKKPDGTLEPRTRTLYSTQPRARSSTRCWASTCSPGRPATAFSMGDANATNFRYLNHFFETDQAQSVTELDQILKRNQGIPWVNTLAADSSGQGLLRRHLGRPERVRTRRRRPATRRSAQATFQALGLPVLDGSRSSASGTPTPTRSSRASSAPRTCRRLFRDDYVENSNDSYWLSNPQQPLRASPGSSATRTPSARCARASGLVMIRAAARAAPTAGPATASRSSSCRTRCSRTASTRASCGATSWSPICETQPDADRLERARST